jgi:hypothetical protein
MSSRSNPLVSLHDYLGNGNKGLPDPAITSEMLTALRLLRPVDRLRHKSPLRIRRSLFGQAIWTNAVAEAGIRVLRNVRFQFIPAPLF